MSQTIRAVLFDYGLVLTGPPAAAAWARIQQVLGIEEKALSDAYWSPRSDYDRGSCTGAQYWQLVAGRQLAPAELDALTAADTDLWTEPNQPMIDWALRLQEAGMRTGILSNLGDDMTRGILARLPWLAGFDYHVWSHTLLTIKPDPVVYQAAVAGLDVPAAQILFVDDREDNIAGARSCGLQAIRYKEHRSFLEELNVRGLGELWSCGNGTPSHN